MSTNGRERLLDWDLDAPFRPSDDKQAQREEIARLTDEYLARGGVITYLPYDPTAEIVDRAMNTRLLGFEGATRAYIEECNDTLLNDDDIAEDFFDPYG